MVDTSATAGAKRKRAKKRAGKAASRAKTTEAVSQRINYDELVSAVSVRPNGRGASAQLHPRQKLVLDTEFSDTESVKFMLDVNTDPRSFIREFRRGLRRHRKGVKMLSTIKDGNVVHLWVARATDPSGTSVTRATNQRPDIGILDEPEDGPDKGAREADARDAVPA